MIEQQTIALDDGLSPSAMTAYILNPTSGNPPKSLVVLLHGVGSNGQDLISLAPEWADALPDTVFVSPDAPFAFNMAPFPMPGAYQWFSLLDRDPSALLEGVKTVKPLLDSFLQKLLQNYKIAEENCALAGFSQGTMLSLYAGPRQEKPLAGILGYSGALLGGEHLNEDDTHRIPIHIIHGESDDVVPVMAWEAAKKSLEMKGFSVSGHTTPGLGHGIDEAGIESGREFLNKIL